MSQCVDLESPFDSFIRDVQELLASDDTCVVDNDRDLTNILPDLIGLSVYGVSVSNITYVGISGSTVSCGNRYFLEATDDESKEFYIVNLLT